MRVEEVIGAAVRRRRVELGWNQAQLGDAVAPFTGRAWSRQAVSNAEKGKRDFVAADLLALALALDVKPAYLLTPRSGDSIDLPGGHTIGSREALLMFLMPGDSGTVDTVALRQSVTDLARRITAAADVAMVASKEAAQLVDAIDHEEGRP